MLTCVSSNLVLYGVSFVVHSSSGMVRIVMYFGLLVLQVGPSVCLYVYCLYCVGGHIQYFAICVNRPGP
jgi:hypothetical protein